MEMYINGRFLMQRLTGVQRYARELVVALDEIISGKERDGQKWFILIPKNAKCDLQLKSIKVKKCGLLHGHLWEQIELPYYARKGYLINLCNCAPIVKNRQLLVIHDAAVVAHPEAYSWKFIIWYKIMHTICSKKIDKIITVSNFSKEEIHKYYAVPREKIFIIYNGIDHMYRLEMDDSILKKIQLKNKKYVLAVSSKNPTKNFQLVLKTARLLNNINFVIVGGTNNDVFSNEKIESLPNVIYTGYVSDEELVSLYRHAAVFVYPSLYEGFGIPPLEAMSQGCPVIVSNTASLPEICESHAEYCDVVSEENLKKKIENIINKEVMEDIHTEEFLAKYSWKQSAYQMYELLRR